MSGTTGDCSGVGPGTSYDYSCAAADASNDGYPPSPDPAKFPFVQVEYAEADSSCSAAGKTSLQPAGCVADLNFGYKLTTCLDANTANISYYDTADCSGPAKLHPSSNLTMSGVLTTTCSPAPEFMRDGWGTLANIKVRGVFVLVVVFGGLAWRAAIARLCMRTLLSPLFLCLSLSLSLSAPVLLLLRTPASFSLRRFHSIVHVVFTSTHTLVFWLRDCLSHLCDRLSDVRLYVIRFAYVRPSGLHFAHGRLSRDRLPDDRLYVIRAYHRHATGGCHFELSDANLARHFAAFSHYGS